MSRVLGIASGPSAGSVPFRVCVFFAVNPDETLRADDVAAKFGCAQWDVRSLLLNAVQKGFVAAESQGPGRGKQATYAIGPELAALIGHLRKESA